MPSERSRRSLGVRRRRGDTHGKPPEEWTGRLEQEGSLDVYGGGGDGGIHSIKYYRISMKPSSDISRIHPCQAGVHAPMLHASMLTNCCAELAFPESHCTISQSSSLPAQNGTTSVPWPLNTLGTFLPLVRRSVTSCPFSAGTP